MKDTSKIHPGTPINKDSEIQSMIHRTPTGYIVDRDPDSHTYDMFTDAVTIAATILMEDLVRKCHRVEVQQ